jgi:hypothetical protein
MFLQRVTVQHSLFRLRLIQKLRFQRPKNPIQACRTKTTATPASITKNSAQKFGMLLNPKICQTADANLRAAYPESILIYHAGTGRTVFLGILKVSTIFVCAYYCLAEAPAQFRAGVELWRIAGKGRSAASNGCLPALLHITCDDSG